jgi:hypothetical protein
MFLAFSMLRKNFESSNKPAASVVDAVDNSSMFVLVAQLFTKVPALKAIAPTSQNRRLQLRKR